MARDMERFTGFPNDRLLNDPVENLSQESDNLPRLGLGIRKHIDFMASHMFFQLQEYEAAQKRTAGMFEQLLRQLEQVVVTFQQSFIKREVPASGIYAQIDADRSIGILHLLWHTISFVSRGNTKPMALGRNGRDPMFSGRIVAIMGDYRDMAHADYADILEEELASLYIPASPAQPAVMRFAHRKDELFFHQADATQQFLMKLLEAVCAGGYFHESQE